MTPRFLAWMSGRQEAPPPLQETVVVGHGVGSMYLLSSGTAYMGEGYCFPLLYC